MAVLAGCANAATDGGASQAYDVTIINNSGQVVTQPLVIAHQSGFKVYEVGQPASEALA